MKGQRVLVVGLARSGVAAAGWLAQQGARVLATDAKPAAEFAAFLLEGLEAQGVQLELGGHVPGSFTSAELVVVSPGVPWELPELQAARAAGVPVLAEVELAVQSFPGRVVGITGTKGKSTTTAALGAMLRAAGGDVRVGGNIGEPAITLVGAATPSSLLVLELSSFQLEGIRTLHPEVALFLNLSPDHLDRHPDLAAYAAAKAQIFRNQTPSDWAIVDATDPAVVTLARADAARLVGMAAADPGWPNAAWFAGGHAQLRRDGITESLFERSSVRLPGDHLALDLLAAAAAARLLGTPLAAIASAVAAFAGAPHVLEQVSVIGGVAFYNDSKATNVAAVRKSIEAFAGRVLPIIGGRYKGGDFALLREPLQARHALVLAIGEAAPLVEAALAGAVPVVRCASLAAAVARGLHEARPGDTVVLAPGCSSFDMFRDYEQRGQAFKDEVRRLAAAN